jgi:hypothetical protein
MTVIQLADHQLPELARLIAAELAPAPRLPHVPTARVVDPMSCLVDASTLAEALGVSRRFVYEHADELGAQRLGEGPKARLRFDVQAARAAMSRSAGKRSLTVVPSDDGASERSPRRRSARLPIGVPEPGSVLKIRGAA